MCFSIGRIIIIIIMAEPIERRSTRSRKPITHCDDKFYNLLSLQSPQVPLKLQLPLPKLQNPLQNPPLNHLLSPPSNPLPLLNLLPNLPPNPLLQTQFSSYVHRQKSF